LAGYLYSIRPFIRVATGLKSDTGNLWEKIEPDNGADKKNYRVPK